MNRFDGNLRLMETMRERLGPLPGPEESYGKAFAWGQAARRCAFCHSSRACKAWLEAGGGDSGYREFCPNAAFFDQLRMP
jgi:hypothetical protein